MFRYLSAQALVINLLITSFTKADITVSEADFADGHFSYHLDTTNPTTFANSYNDAVITQRGTGQGNPAWHPTYLICFNGFNPSVQFRFLFQDAGNTPRSVTIKDRLVHFNNNFNFTRSTVSYFASSTNTNFEDIRSAETPRDGSTVTDSFATYVLPLNNDTTFQYQVAMTTLPGDFNGQLDSCLDQFARSNQGGDSSFTIAFSSDPPPSLNPLNIPDNSTIVVTFNDPNGVEPTTTPVANSLLASGGDSTFSDGNESSELISTATQVWDATGQTLTLTFATPLAADAYQITIDPQSFLTNHGQILPDENAVISGGTPDFSPPVISDLQFNSQSLPQSDHLDGTLSAIASSTPGIASASFYYSQDGSDETLIATDSDPSNGLSAPFAVTSFASGTYLISVHIVDTLGQLSRLSLPFAVDEDPAVYLPSAASFNCTSQQLTASTPQNGGRFGSRVAIDGSVAAIAGDPYQNNRGLFILENSNGTWSESKFIFPADAATNDEFGLDLAISGDLVAVSAPRHNSSGAVYIYRRDTGGPNNWGLLKKIPHPDAGSRASLGKRIALHGNVLAVIDSSSPGQIYLFHRNQGGADNWGPTQVLSPPNIGNSNFGSNNFNLDLHGDTLAVSSSSYIEDFNVFPRIAGAVFVFQRSNGSWNFAETLFPDTTESNSGFGTDLAVFDNTIAVAAPADDKDGLNQVGATYLFENQNGAWTPTLTLTPPDAGNSARTSSSVALYGNRLAIGSEDFSFSGITGTTILYDRDQDGPNGWGEVERFSHPTLGLSVALSGGVLLAGAHEDNLPGNSLNQEGSAHFFDTLPSPPTLGTLTFSSNSDLVIPVSDDCPLPTGQSPVATSILASGGDGTFSDGNEIELVTTLSTISYDEPSGSILLTLSPPLSNDTYQVTLAPSSIVDHIGTPLSSNANTSVGLLDGPNITGLTFDGASFPDPILLKGTITIAATATNNLASAEFFLDGQSLGTDTDPANGLSFLFNPSGLDTGSYTLSVTVTDANGIFSTFAQQVELAPILITDFSPADIPTREHFGIYLAYHNNLLVVGSPKTDNEFGRDAGAAYLYQRNPLDRTWSFVKKFIPPDNSTIDEYGRAVAISDDILAVGHPLADNPGFAFSGSVHLYQRNLGGPDNWGLLTTITPDLPLSGSNFGQALALQNDTLVVGAYKALINGIRSGAAYVFDRNNGGASNWGQVQILSPTNPSAASNFGQTLAIDGEIIAVGTPQSDPIAIQDLGSVHLFEQDLGGDDNWGHLKEVFPSDGETRNYFGRGLALSGELLVVGAPEHDIAPGFRQGAAYCFSRNEGGEDNWGEFLKIPSPNPSGNNTYFGESIALSSDFLYISAPSGGKFNRFSRDPAFFGRGFIYLFDRNNSFSQSNRFSAPESDGDDGFGASLVVQGDILATASAEDDVQTAFDAPGTAYIFDSTPPFVPIIPPALGSPSFDSYHTLLLPLIDNEALPTNLSPIATSFLASGGDGTFNDGNEVDLLSSSAITFDSATETIRLASSTPLTNDTYQVILDPSSIVDDSGEELPAELSTLTATQVLLTSFTLTLDDSSIEEATSLDGLITLNEVWFEDLPVTLSSNRASALNSGPIVTIPAGQLTASFTISAVNDNKLTAPIEATLTGTAPSSTVSQTAVLIVDNDWPILTLSLSRSTIPETAGPNAVQATLTRFPVLPQSLSVSISNNLPGAVSAPSHLSFRPGSGSITFHLSPIDNNTVDGPRIAEFTATANALGTTVGTSNLVTLALGDDEGDSLELSFPNHFAVEGAADQLLLRNTSGNVLVDIEVTLTTSDASEITLPETVTLLADTSELLIPFSVPVDADGIQNITLTAEASGFTATELPLTIIDSPLPDFVVTDLNVPLLAETEASLPLNYQIRNIGASPNTTKVTQRIFLSSNPLLDNDDPLYTQSEFAAPLQPGSSLPFTQNIVTPFHPGSYYLIVATDALNANFEIIESNNTLVTPSPIIVSAAYSATISTEQSTYAVNSDIVLSGSATRSSGGPAPLVPVNIHLGKNGTTRILTLLTDANGNFTTTWRALPNEGGDFTLGATHPGLTAAATQDTFSILALNSANFPTTALSFDEGSSISTTGQISNPSATPLTGLTAEVIGAPPGLNVTPIIPSPDLGGNQSFDLQVDLSANAGFTQSGTFLIRLTTDQNVTLDIPISVNVSSLVANLIATPASLKCSVLRGGQKFPEFTLSNTGGAPSGPINIALPGIPWLRLAAPTPLPSLEPGESTTLSLNLTPGNTVPLTLFSGNIAINPTSSGAPIRLPFEFRTVSDLKGDLLVDVVNEFFFFTPNAPKLEGATVTLRDPITAAQVTTATTASDGLASFPNLNEGWYTIDVSAPDHTVWRNNVFVIAGQTTSRQAFLSKQLVTYTWTVEEIEIDDQYRIAVESQFEANIEAPVVTVSPAVIDVEDLLAIGDSKVIEMTIENHGLIDAEQGTFEFSSHPFYEIVPLVEELLAIPAQTQVLVPVTVTRVGAFAADGSIEKAGGLSLKKTKNDSEREEVPCGMGGRMRYEYNCGDNNVQKGSPITVSGVQGNCPGASFGGNPAPAILNSIAQNSPAPPAPLARPSLGTGYSNGSGGGNGGGFVDSNQSSSVGFVSSQGDVQRTLFDDFSTVLLASGTPCDCTFGSPDICVGSEVSFSLPNLLSETAAFITNKLPSGFQLKNTEFSISAGGKACVCCENNEYGLKTEGELKGTIKLTVEYGLPDISFATPTIAGWQLNDISLDGDALKVETDLVFAVSLKREKDCKGEEQICVTVLGEIKGFVGAEASASVKATYRAPGTVGAINYEGKLGGKVGLDLTLGIERKWCNDGKPGASKFVAKLEAVAQIEGSLSAKDDADIGTTAKFLSLGGKVTLLDNTAPPAADSAAKSAPTNTKDLPPPTLDLDALLAQAPTEPFDASGVILPDEQILASPEIQAILPSGAANTCAKVKIRLDNSAVMTRTAFRATLGLTNNLPDQPLSNVGFNLDVRDTAGNPANDKFNIQVTSLTNLDTIDGTGTIPGDLTGTTQWTLIPLDTAAPTEVTTYTVGGSIRYEQAATPFTIPVEAAPITVRPDASLLIKYFHQRDVFADDPLTPEIEPSLPFYLAMQVCNDGAGAANNLRVTSAQPSVFDNEKGLLIDFNIINTQIDGQGTSPSLTANLGTIDPAQKKTAIWELNSSILGLFTDYSATFQHLDGFGDPRLSLLESIEIFEMIRVVNALGDKDDGKPDFLTNDVPDPGDYPDTIHLSDGSTAPVALVQAASTAGSALGYTIDFTAASGWTYLRIPDPSNGLTLTSVQRSDGLILPVGSNTWTSDKTLVGLTQPPVYENIFHLLDCDSTGSYTLTFSELPADDSTAPQSAITMLDPDSPTDIPLMWSGSDADSGLAFYNIYVSTDDGPFELWLANTSSTSAIFSGDPDRSYAFYSVATDFAGNQEAAPSSADANTTVSISNLPPLIEAIEAQTVPEGQPFSFPVIASDPDGPDNALSYSIDSDATGLVINETTGNILWNTTEADGNRVIAVNVTVTDSNSPPLSSIATFDLTVAESNRPPVVDAIPSQTIPARGILLIAPNAQDLDSPSQTLRYSLSSSAPVGMTIDSESGLISWTPARAQSNTTVEVDLIVTDNGLPAQATTVPFTVAITPGDDQAPLFDAIPIVLWIKGDTYSTTISASDPDGDLVTLSADTSSTPNAVFAASSALGNGSASTFTLDTSDANSGTYTIPLSASANNVTTDATLLIQIRENNLYWSWALQNFGSSFRGEQDFNRAGLNGDPDNDQRDNIHELTFMTNPLLKDQVPISIHRKNLGDVSVTTLSVHRRIGSHDFTRLQPLSSPDLSPLSWSIVPPRDYNAVIDARGDDDSNPLSESVDISIFDLNSNTSSDRHFYQIESSLRP